MGRTSGLALLVFGIAVGVLGAIMRFAIETTTTGFDSEQAGIILLIAGVVLALVAVIWLVVGSRKRATAKDRL